MSNTQQMRCKAVVSGDIVELYFYKVPITCGNKNENKNIDREKRVGDEKREDNLYRARKNIRQIIWSNQGEYTKFITLTYANTVLNIDTVRYDISKFVKNMKNRGYDMKYLYVLENQRERGIKEDNQGCLHIHMVLFIDKYIPKQDIDDCWKKGYTHITAIENINNLGAYVCKYITKDNLQIFGKRTFSVSLNLKRPSEERFYTLGYSDSDINFTPEQVLNAINVCYHKKLIHDYIDSSSGEGKTQEVLYYQGKWKNNNIIKEKDPLYAIKRQIDDLHIPQNDTVGR